MSQQLEKSKAFHSTQNTWSGKGTMQYADAIKDLIEKYDCKTLLDYGCGKGVQYSEYKVHEHFGLDLNDIYQFDPAYEPLAKEPDWNQKFDGSICLDVLYFVTEDELKEIKARLEQVSTKFCYVTLQLQPPKPSSLKSKPYALLKDEAWWRSQFADWKSDAELILEFRINNSR
jgi:hypothetical protein